MSRRKDAATEELSSLFTWRTSIVRDRKLTATQKHVALTLSLFMAEDGSSAFPSIATLAQRTSRDERTVQRAIGELERIGWLVVKRTRGGSRNDSNRYSAAVPPTPLPLDNPRHDATPGTMPPAAGETPTPGTMPPNPRHHAGLPRHLPRHHHDNGVGRLVAVGFAHDRAVELVAEFGPEAVARQLLNLERTRNVRSKTGWLVKALASDFPLADLEQSRTGVPGLTPEEAERRARELFPDKFAGGDAAEASNE